MRLGCLTVRLTRIPLDLETAPPLVGFRGVDRSLCFCLAIPSYFVRVMLSSRSHVPLSIAPYVHEFLIGSHARPFERSGKSENLYFHRVGIPPAITTSASFRDTKRPTCKHGRLLKIGVVRSELGGVALMRPCFAPVITG